MGSFSFGCRKRDKVMKEILKDSFGRQIKYLRLSVTDKCNMRCFYCLPHGYKGFNKDMLTFSQIVKITQAFSNLGVRHVRLTGGEPLVREGIEDLVSLLKTNKNIIDISMSTNASILYKKALKLKQAGLDRLNISLDSLNTNTFAKITNGYDLATTLSGISAAKEQKLNPIKINMVVMNGINDNEVYDMIDYCYKNDFILRFIETMPVGIGGREASNHYIKISQIIDNIKEKYTLVPTEVKGAGPAKYFKIKEMDFKIGFITPISQHFCKSCNRVRLSSDGMLHLCLGEKNTIDLKQYLTKNVQIEFLENVIKKVIKQKPQEHIFSQTTTTLASMAKTGG
jgi:GTP 3',8-cyclase